jgi:8-oxo-dGTP diphosphatase
MKRYSFCPVCGARLGQPDRRGGAVMKHACPSCGFEFWQNSKPTASALIEREAGGRAEVLLVRRAIEPYRGMWGVPGGFLENGEPPEAGLRREVMEELGLTVQSASLFCVEMNEYPRDDIAEEAMFLISLYYRCSIPADAAPVAGDDAEECAWFPLGSLPREIAFEANRKALGALIEAHAGRPGRGG